MIDDLLLRSIAVARVDCEDLFPEFDSFSENRRIALTDFLFNVGKKTAMQFARTIHLINIGHWEDAAIAMRQSKWAKQVKGRAVLVTKMIEEG
jgi:lysozyme